MRSILAIIIIALMMTGCKSEAISNTPTVQPNELASNEPNQQPNRTSEKVVIYSLKDGDGSKEAIESIYQTITEADLVEVFKKAFEEAEALKGVIKMTAPTYKVIIGSSEYYLLIGEDKTDSIVDLDDSHTMFRLSTSDTIKIREILSWSKPEKAVQGLVMDKKVITRDDSYRVLVATNWTKQEKMTTDDWFAKAEQNRELAWYTIDKEIYDKLHISQPVAIRAAAMQLDSSPPIRFSITAQIIDPILTKSSLYLNLIEEELYNQQLLLTPISPDKEWILDGIKPSRYTVSPINNEADSTRLEQVSIYIFNSEQQLEDGLKDFQKQTELINMLYPRIYKLNNAMIFYWAHGNMEETAKLGSYFDKAVKLLMEK
ncbi:hypothetical protein BK120_25255 [Paenibacillus sp. FSL A5-0031]|uniref:hypothetical protein n=1 Tax=Paenibacillus sp. FSL A5-0031 TaxID=1920420 RepID=UPI00096C4FA3|nr:hypothetical protein [Paenibacillus sp. FSL A5-0031]OME78004.1 hypothetical protein BK120_25255 [Paenibacillus sp. FSL A5-0031]